MKKTSLVFALALAACSARKPPAETGVTFEANGVPASAAAAAEGIPAPSANLVKSSGSMLITFLAAVAPDTTPKPFSIQVTGFKGVTGTVHTSNAVYNRNDAEKKEYQYVGKSDALKVDITDYEVDDVPGTPMQEGWFSATFEGDLPYIYPKKDGNPFTDTLKVTNGKIVGVKVTVAK